MKVGGQVRSLNEWDLDVTYAYDLLNRATSASTSARTVSFAYDALNRRTSEASGLGTKTFEYDLAGRRTRLNWPDSFYVTYDYNVAGDMTAIRENGSTQIIGFTYDDRGRRTRLDRANGRATLYSYDNVSRLTQIDQDLAPYATYDIILGYSYNPAGQLAATTRNNDTYAWTNHYAVNRNYTANGRNQYTASGSVTPTYDARGNLTSAGSTAYMYTSQNQLAGVQDVIGLLYDPLGRLGVSSSTSNFYKFDHDGDLLLTEYGISNNLLRRYVYGPGTDEPLVWYEGSGTSDRRYYHADERGSIIAVSDAAGYLIGNPLAYDEYGIPQSANAGRFQYTGQAWLPELGMYHYRARAYSPTLGRFMQTDPIGYGDGMNMYAYVGNDPLNSTDPSGLCGFTNWGYYEATQGDDGKPSGPWKLMHTYVTQDSPCESLGQALGLLALLATGGGGDASSDENIIVTATPPPPVEEENIVVTGTRTPYVPAAPGTRGAAFPQLDRVCQSTADLPPQDQGRLCLYFNSYRNDPWPPPLAPRTPHRAPPLPLGLPDECMTLTNVNPDGSNSWNIMCRGGASNRYLTIGRVPG